jgi:hypothetical protein
MNKYLVIIGELTFQRWGGEYLAISSKSIDELQEDKEFLNVVDEILNEMYYEFAEEDEDYDDFISDGGLVEIRPYKETDGNLEVIYNE